MMTESLEALRSRVDSAVDLQAVVCTMKVISLVRKRSKPVVPVSSAPEKLSGQYKPRMHQLLPPDLCWQKALQTQVWTGLSLPGSTGGGNIAGVNSEVFVCVVVSNLR